MWIAQAVLSGITVAIGYAVGSLAGWAVRLVAHGISRFTRAGWSPSRRLVLASWWSVATVGTTVSAGYLLASSSWQTELSELVEREVPGPNHYVLTLVIAAGLFLGLLALARGLRGAARWLRRILGRRVPLPVAASSSVVMVSAVTVWA